MNTLQTMNTKPAPLSEEQLARVRVAIDDLDLGPIRFKLMDHGHGRGWTRELVDQTEPWYRRFLFLNAKMIGTGRPVVPNKLVDEFWHTHILDTAKYADDCDRAFGFFLHHFPYFGARNAVDARELELAFSDTMRMYQQEYGEAPYLPRETVVEFAGYTQRHSPASHCANVCTSPCDSAGDAWRLRPTA